MSQGLEFTVELEGEIMAICIACAEEIKKEAKLCKHCGTVQSDRRFSQDTPSAKYPNLYVTWWVQLLFIVFVLVDPATGLTNPQNSVTSFIPDLAAVVFVGNFIPGSIMLFVYTIRKQKVPETRANEWFQSFYLFAGAGLLTLYLGIEFLMP